jgi:hypothetical protein
MKKTAIISIVMVLVLACSTLFAVSVSAKRHPNLAKAQKLIETATAKITAAQVANEFDMDGHAAKAKDLLAQAYVEIKLAAEAANVNK